VFVHNLVAEYAVRLVMATRTPTDFHLPDSTVTRFIELRDQGADRDQLAAELQLDGEAVEERKRLREQVHE